MVQIFPAIVFSLYWKNQTKEATIAGLIAGLIVTFSVYATGKTFGMYEGFWGLLANMIVTFSLNPFFVKKLKNISNSVLEELFENEQPKDNKDLRKGA